LGKEMKTTSPPLDEKTAERRVEVCGCFSHFRRPRCFKKKKVGKFPKRRNWKGSPVSPAKHPGRGVVGDGTSLEGARKKETGLYFELKRSRESSLDHSVGRNLRGKGDIKPIVGIVIRGNGGGKKKRTAHYKSLRGESLKERPALMWCMCPHRVKKKKNTRQLWQLGKGGGKGAHHFSIQRFEIGEKESRKRKGVDWVESSEKERSLGKKVKGLL